MTWGRMDDKFHRSRKVRELRKTKEGELALSTWVYWWSWCLSDPELTGIVSEDDLTTRERPRAKLLVSVGLWEEVPGGYKFHDFHEYNPTKDQRQKKLDNDKAISAAKRAESRATSPTASRATSHPRARAGHGKGTYKLEARYSGSSDSVPDWMDPPGCQTPAPDCLDELEARRPLRAVRQ